VRLLACLVGAAALVGCSDSGSGADQMPTVTEADVGAVAETRPPVGTLPGESEQAAIDRILKECYREFGVEVGSRQADGSQSLTAPTPEVLQAAVNACQERLVDAGLAGDFAPTDDEIRSNYGRIAEWRECIEEQGYDLPAMISLEEFLASAGRSTGVFAGIDDVLNSLTPSARSALLGQCPQT
jgi:hypothetical protein